MNFPIFGLRPEVIEIGQLIVESLPEDWIYADQTIDHAHSRIKFWIANWQPFEFHFWDCAQEMIKLTLREKMYLRSRLLEKVSQAAINILEPA